MNNTLITLKNNTPEQVSLQQLCTAHGIMVDRQQPLALSIEIAANAQVTLIDDLIEYDTLVDASTIEHNFQFILHEHSTLKYRMRMAPSDITTAAAHNITVSKYLRIILQGQGAHADVHCASYATNSSVLRFYTQQEHLVGHTTSTLNVRGVLDQRARLTCNNMIRISKGASKSHALQNNKNLLLSPATRAISIPQLEILANDVTCKHGAATSACNPEQLFYVQSRGLDALATRAMLVQAFLE